MPFCYTIKSMDTGRGHTPLPAQGGSYALVFAHPGLPQISWGRRSGYGLPEGLSIYLGSAWGPGGLRGRLRHHLRIAPAPHWHLDGLRPRLTLLAILCAEGARGLECCWGQALAQAGWEALLPGFGASDCRTGCPAHFWTLSTPPKGVWLREIEASLVCLDT